MTRRIAALAAGACLLPALFAGPAAAAPKQSSKAKGKGPAVDVQLLGINDFHGNLEPPGGSGGNVFTESGPVAAGGIEYLSTHVDRLRAQNPKGTFVVSAGDLVGASPLLSALFHDEPTVEAMNQLGLDYNAVGNHEFDEGAAELLRLQNGGCHPEDGCQDGTPFGGAAFGFLGANVFRGSSDRTLLPPYAIEKVRGERIAFVGMTLEGTPQIVAAAGIQGLEFRDEATSVNRLIPELKRRGAETVVVLLHEGGFQSGRYDECNGISGPVVDIVKRTSPEVDLFLTGHTHQAYDCVIDGRPVTSASAFGRLITDVDMRIDKKTGEPSRIATENRIVTRDVARDEEQSDLIARYQEFAAPIANRVIGSTTAAIGREESPAGETALGDVIADAQLAATRPAEAGGAQVAFMNPGGIRADLDAGDVTYGEAFTVQPFGNTLVTMTLTGARIEALLEQQFADPSRRRILQVSEGFSYAYAPNGPAGDKVDPASIRLGGAPIDPGASYRVTVNSFLADGGDGFTVLRDGTDRLGGAPDLDALEAYLEANSPVAPGPRDRITLR